MNCPKCKSSMEVVKVGSIEVDRCTSCKGIWFDAFESEAVKRGGAAAVAAADTGSASKGKEKNQQGKIECPKCHTRTIRMVDREQPHIWFESCSVCYGRFFDAGEFRDMADKGLGDLFRRWKAKERPLT